MAEFDPRAAADLVDAQRGQLPGTPAEQTDYAAKFRQWATGRSPEDRRAAVGMAVGAANTLVQIAVAVFVAIGGFIQFAFTGGLRWDSPPTLLLAAAALLVLASMCVGFFAVGKAYRRGEGREQPDQPGWATGPLRSLLHAQSGLGLLGLLVFAAAIALANALGPPPRNAVTVTLDQQALALPAGAGPVTLEGSWSAMVLRVGNTVRLDLGSVPQGQTRTLTITPP